MPRSRANLAHIADQLETYRCVFGDEQGDYGRDLVRLVSVNAVFSLLRHDVIEICALVARLVDALFVCCILHTKEDIIAFKGPLA